MQKTTVFAIKAYIAMALLSLLISFIAGLVLGDLFLNSFFAGVFAIVMSFVSAYVATGTLLKNSRLAKADAVASIEQTWRVCLVVNLILVLFTITNTLERGTVFTIFTALTFVAVYMALAMLKKQQR